MVYICGDKQKKDFSAWKNMTRLFKTMTMVRSLTHFMQVVNDRFTTELKDAIMEDKDLQIKIKAINRMIYKFNQGIVQQFIAWNKKAKVLKIQSQLGDKQKKKMIEMLVNFEG